jgi:hypothetical protein
MEEKKFDGYFSKKITASIEKFEKIQKGSNTLNIPKGIVFSPETLDFQNRFFFFFFLTTEKSSVHTNTSKY